MVQHVTINPSLPNEPEKPDAHPHTVMIWRDDQTIKWGLADGYSWPNPDGDEPQPVPIVFLPKDASRGYFDWPGSNPMPIGPRPPKGTADRRFYTASADTLLDPNEPFTEKYHYAFFVCPADNPICPLPLLPPGGLTAPVSQQWQREGDAHWYDPEVENQNIP
jgi:hypothetical protein